MGVFGKVEPFPPSLMTLIIFSPHYPSSHLLVLPFLHFKCLIQWHQTHTLLCNHRPPSISRTFSSSQTETPHPPYSLSLRPWQPLFYLLSLNLITQGALCNWNHTIFFCVWFIPLSIMSSRFMLKNMSAFSSFLSENNYFIIWLYHLALSIYLLIPEVSTFQLWRVMLL